MTPAALSERDAAIFCGFVRSNGEPRLNRFRADCPVAPLPFGGRSRIYDRRQLQDWVDQQAGRTPTPAPTKPGNPFDEWQARGVGAS